MQTLKLLMAMGAFAAAGWTQPSAGVAGPVTGFIFDAQAGAVRPMLGIPGAAYLGPAVAPGLSAASVAPDGSRALGVERNGKLMFYSGLRTAAPTASVIVGAIAGVDYFAWAGDSGSAAVFSSGTGQGQILTSLAASPAAAAPIDLSGLPGKVTVLAFDGQSLIVGVVSGESGGIYLAGGPAGMQRVSTGASPSAIAVAGSSLYFADRRSQQISEVQNYAGTPAALTFANDASIDAPVGLQVSADGQRLYVANAGNRSLAVYDIAARTPVQNVGLNFTPTRLDRFGDTSVFLMNASGEGPLYVARDGAAGRAAVYFVPSPGKSRPARPETRP